MSGSGVTKVFSDAETTKKSKQLEHLQHEKALEKHGVTAEHIDSIVRDYMQSEVHIAVTGSSGAGKSSLINSLRSLRASDRELGAAAVGVTETTMEPQPYPFPNNKSIVLWDLPGVGTQRFPKDGYVKAVGLSRFQVLLICSCTRFTESDIWLLNQASTENVRCLIVRTKIDLDVANTLDKHDLQEHDEDAGGILEEMYRTIRDNIRSHTGPRVQRVYLVSNKLAHHTKWDFDDLNVELAENAHVKDKKSMMMMLVASSERVINKKMAMLQEDIESVAERASQAAEEDYRGIITRAAEHYKTWFGISEEELRRFDIKVDQLDSRLQDMQAKLQKTIDEGFEVYCGTAHLHVPYFGPTLNMNANIAENERRSAAHEIKIQKLKEDVKTRSPVEIRKAARKLLGNFLQASYNFAIGILEERKKMA